MMIHQNNNDAKARARALDTSESFIVRAPAGSGKTTLLVNRYIHLLSVVDNPEEILAVTFTRKATAEMRERILNILDPDSPHRLPTKKDNSMVERVRQRAVELNWNLQQQPSRLQIMTIDGLAGRLVRSMPWASRFGSAPRVTENADDIYRTAAINTLEATDPDNQQLNEAIGVLYELCESKSSKLQNLIVSTLQKRDQWLRFLVAEPYLEDAKLRMESVWKRLIERDLSDLHKSFPQGAAELLNLDDLLQADKQTLQEWNAIAEALLTKKGTWRQRVSHFQDLSKNVVESIIESCKKSPDLQQKLDLVGRKHPSPVIEDDYWISLQAISVVLEFAVGQLRMEFRRRGEVDFIEVALQAQQALGSEDNPTDLALVLDHHLSHILVDEFQDTSVTQEKLLTTLIAGWSPGDGRTLFLVGDPMQSIYRFREAEIGIFLSIEKNGLGNLHPEPLQLNQNFRSNKALVKSFNAIFEQVFPKDVDISRGQVNYTPSHSEIKGGNSESLCVKFSISQNSSENKSLQSIGSKRFEAQQVVDDIQKFVQTNPKDTVAVLVRSRQHASEIINVMDEQNISYYAPEFIELKANEVVRDLLSLTRAMLNFADRTSWLAILRAPWCGLTLNDLLAISADWHDTIWNRINDKQVLGELSEDGRTRIKRIRKVMTSALGVRGRFGVRQWVEDTWVSLGGPACVWPVDLKNAELFFDLIERNARGTGVLNLADFEESELARLYAVPKGSPQPPHIQISTIHNAKGLEFDAVFIPQLGKITRNNPRELLAWAEMVFDTESGGGSNLLVSPIETASAKTQTGNYQYLNRWNKEKFETELTRLAYVAFTRAKKQFYCYADVTGGSRMKGDSLLARVFPQGTQDTTHKKFNPPYSIQTQYWTFNRSDSESQPCTLIQDISESSVVPDLIRLPRNWKPPPAPPALKLTGLQMEAPGNTESIDFEWAGNIAVWVGLVAHDWLRMIVETGLNNWNAHKVRSQRPLWAQRMLSMGISAKSKDLKFALDRIERALIQVLEDDTGRWLLDNRHADSQTEYRLTGYIDGQFKNVVLDRTFIDDEGIRWIVDYKTGTTLGDKDEFLENEVKRYTDQLKLYQKIMSGMDSTPIRLGLYFPMFPDWRELK